MSGDSPQPVLDTSILQTLISLGQRRGRDLLGQLTQIFLDQGPKSFAHLRTAISEGNTKEVHETAHSLKGSYQSLGMPRLGELSRQLEEQGRTGDLSMSSETLRRLEETFETTRVELAAYLEAQTDATDP